MVELPEDSLLAEYLEVEVLLCPGCESIIAIQVNEELTLRERHAIVDMLLINHNYKLSTCTNWLFYHMGVVPETKLMKVEHLLNRAEVWNWVTAQ